MSILAAGATLLGGLFGRSKSMSPGRQLQSTVHHAVEAGKAYGFNPLTLLGVNVPQHVPANNAMLGQSVIDAGMMLADRMKGRLREADQVNRLETANRRLAKTVEKLTLRPTVGGVYASRQMTPTRAQALGLAYDQSDPASSAAGNGLSVPSARGVDQFGNPVTSLSFGGERVEGDPNFSDASIAENRYGDLGGSIVGLGVLAADARKYAQSEAKRRAAERARVPFSGKPFGITPTKSERRIRSYGQKIGPMPRAPIYDKNRSVVNPASNSWMWKHLNFGAMFQ